jgi:hypothetical protein
MAGQGNSIWTTDPKGALSAPLRNATVTTYIPASSSLSATATTFPETGEPQSPDHTDRRVGHNESEPRGVHACVRYTSVAAGDRKERPAGVEGSLT